MVLRRINIKEELKSGQFLDSVEIADLPPHDFKLKHNTLIMLLCNSRITYLQTCSLPSAKD